MFRRKIPGIILVLVLLLIIFGCGTKPPAREVSPNNESKKVVTKQTPKAEPVKTPKAEPVKTATPVNFETVFKNQTIYSNYIFSPKELSKAELTARLGIPVDIEIVDTEDNNLNKDTIPYRPSNDNSYLKKVLGKPVTRQPGETVFNFARRAAIELRARAKNLGNSDMVTSKEEKVYQIFGSYPVLCYGLADTFTEIMRQNGVWANLVQVRVNNANPLDTHVTAEIYDPERSKWIVVDPTFVGVFRNKQGRFLNVGEIQADLKDAKFIPFVPSAGYDRYYIKPISKLYGLVMYKGSFIRNYLQTISETNSPYKFPVEKIKVNNGFIYLWRSSNQMAVLNIPGGQRGLNLTQTLYRLNLENGEKELAQFTYKNVTSIKLMNSKNNPREKFLELVSDRGGGLLLNPEMKPGKIYIVNALVRTKTEAQKLYLGYQGDETEQWGLIEGDKWKNVSYMIIPGSVSNSIYLTLKMPIVFDIKDLRIYEVGDKL